MNYIKHFFKKIYTKHKYGVSCCDMYNLCDRWAVKLRNDIKAYKEYAGKHIDLRYDDFDKDIDKMIEAFDMIVNESFEDLDNKERQAKIDEGLALFAKRFTKFWY